MKQLILASISPRRSQLLRQSGYNFIVHGSNIADEKIKAPLPGGVELLALEKAEDVASSYGSGIILGADTVVIKDDKILGKPKDPEDARSMLNMLSGKYHQVITGFALVDASRKQETLTDHVVTTVKMRNLSGEEIDDYIKSGEPEDKAGAYGIQGKAAVFVDSVDGCFFNVVGLPLSKVYKYLALTGITPDFGKNIC